MLGFPMPSIPPSNTSFSTLATLCLYPTFTQEEASPNFCATLANFPLGDAATLRGSLHMPTEEISATTRYRHCLARLACLLPRLYSPLVYSSIRNAPCHPE
jgi:hypothetical protein